jgi:hypothetical protein
MEAIKVANGQKRLPQLNRAIRHLRSSLEADHWLDEMHLKRGEASAVFTKDAMLVFHLRNLRHTNPEDISDETLAGWIDRITRVDRNLATEKIEEALNSGVAADQLVNASRKIIEGDQARDASRPAAAILLFRNAWRAAARAMNHL